MKEKSKYRFIVISGVSASGKTTVFNELMKMGNYSTPTNFTTRKPRKEVTIDEEGDFSSTEFDEYVFINKDVFIDKLNKGHFLENTNYGGNMYGISAALPDGDIAVILDPIGKAQVLNKISTDERFKDYRVECFFLDCDKKLQEERIKARGDTPEEIEKRKKDFEWFFPSSNDMVLDAGWNPRMVAEIIHNFKS